MARKTQHRSAAKSRDAPMQKRSGVMLCSTDAWQTLLGDGYRPITSCPEVMMCVNVYADLIGSMTIHLMANTERGDIRIRNELSRKLDINPNRWMTRANLIALIVETLLTHGNQVTVPVYRGGYLEELLPVPPSQVAFEPADDGYRVRIAGRAVHPDTLLHFAWRPDPERPWQGRGVSVSLKDIVHAIRQADSTRQALLSSPAPSIIVKVDGLTEEFSSPGGRAKLRQQYIDASDTGQPWMIPAEAFSVEQIRPLNLADLAIKDNLELDKRAIAALMGVPAFMVGVGAYNQVEYNHFVATRVMAVAKVIEQTLSRGLIYSPDMYLRFNNRALLAYSLTEINAVCQAMSDRMAIRRNEWRDWIGLPPDAEMDELLALENYLPVEELANQKKLKGGVDDGETDASGPG